MKSSLTSQTVSTVIHRNLLFVHGKGGVGKTAVSKAIAQGFAQMKKRTLWITVEDPTLPAGSRVQISSYLTHLNCDFLIAFEEYAAMKIKMASLTQIFLRNKLIQYLAKAAPGIHELVILGKIWFERTHFDHVVVDMPSTGYGLAMFQSTENFHRLFKTGPLHRDAGAMLDTFKNPGETGHLIVSLPEETPLRESLELNHFLHQMFQGNPSAFIANRIFPSVHHTEENPETWPSPLAHSAEEYARKRNSLEEYNLRIWREAGIQFGILPFIPPPIDETHHQIFNHLAKELQDRSYL